MPRQNRLSDAEEETVLEIFQDSLNRIISHPGLAENIQLDAADKFADSIYDPETSGYYYEKLIRWTGRHNSDRQFTFLRRRCHYTITSPK